MNKTMIDNALNDISPEFMEEYAAFCAAAEGSSPRARRFAPKRILAAAAAAAAVIAVSAFAVAQFAKTPPIPAPVGAAPVESAFSVPEDAVLPPTRWGEHTADARLEKDYTLKELYEYSDLVALIRVEDWVCEYVDSENDIG
ncbi:MAG: hypothetical protein J6252_04945, partial [Clostridia bacterium]|nr:hypothetical protein [Clostridia bacterium]